MISWSDHIDVVCSFDDAWRAVADQHQVMRWSAWPKATGYTCSVDGDGTSVGSGIVFTSPTGETMGRQTIVAIDGAVVRNRLQPPVPTFLHPLVGLVLHRRIRPLHREDLANLKRDVEAPST